MTIPAHMAQCRSFRFTVRGLLCFYPENQRGTAQAVSHGRSATVCPGATLTIPQIKISKSFLLMTSSHTPPAAVPLATASDPSALQTPLILQFLMSCFVSVLSGFEEGHMK